MLSKKERLANTEWWSKRQSTFIETYHALYSEKNLSLALKKFGSLENCADVYIGESFHLLMVGADDLAKEAAEYGQIAAQEALKVESFGTLGPPQIRRNLGRYKTTRSLYYAKWILDGKRPANLLSEALQSQFEAYNFSPVWYDIQDVLTDYIYSDLKPQGSEVASFIADNGLDKGDKTTDLLIALLKQNRKCENLSYNQQNLLNSWQKKSLQWYKNHPRLPWWIRLNWILISSSSKESLSIQDLKSEIKGI